MAGDEPLVPTARVAVHPDDRRATMSNGRFCLVSKLVYDGVS